MIKESVLELQNGTSYIYDVNFLLNITDSNFNQFSFTFFF